MRALFSWARSRLTPCFQLPENSPSGYVVGRLSTVDPDLPSKNQTFEYTIITDLSNMFTLDKDKLIVSRWALAWLPLTVFSLV